MTRRCHGEVYFCKFRFIKTIWPDCMMWCSRSTIAPQDLQFVGLCCVAQLSVKSRRWCMLRICNPEHHRCLLFQRTMQMPISPQTHSEEFDRKLYPNVGAGCVTVWVHIFRPLRISGGTGFVFWRLSLYIKEKRFIPQLSKVIVYNATTPGFLCDNTTLTLCFILLL